MLQHQLYVIKNIINRLHKHREDINKPSTPPVIMTKEQALQTASRDKLRVLSHTLVEILLSFFVDYSYKVACKKLNIFHICIFYSLILL